MFCGTRQYNIWKGIKKRCNNVKEEAYKNYGGRGITYDPKWETFIGFWEDMETRYSENLTIERKDVNGNYCKENCKWVTKVEQSRNKTKRRDNSSGASGVHHKVKGSKSYWIAQWSDLNRKRCFKVFKGHEHGEELAFFMACEYREQQIALLNLQGAGYGENHGK